MLERESEDFFIGHLHYILLLEMFDAYCFFLL